MLVYGRSEYKETAGKFVRRLCERVASTRWDSLEELRTLLIQAGQLEQGMFDSQMGAAGLNQPPLAASMRITDLAAAAFYAIWAQVSNSGATQRVASSKADLLRELPTIPQDNSARLTIKIPEGFEFYALFPEQYCLAAFRWADAHAGTRPRRAIVIGIRSIGTTLSALVCSALRSSGWETNRITVRPHGHPFHREVTLPPLKADYTSALVVDEGPGLSGSSMAAVARALAECGMKDIAFLPGHGGEPGTAASPEVRRWWTALPRFRTSSADLRWNGCSLAGVLAKQASGHRSRESGIKSTGFASLPECEDFSAGLWRKHAYTNEQEWPGVSPTFERAKYHYRDEDQGAILWKFAGFGCVTAGGVTSLELAVEQTSRLVTRERVPRILAVSNGFAAMPWVEGTRLTRVDATERATLAQIGRYIVRRTGLKLTRAESEASTERLKEMLCQNIEEWFGKKIGNRARDIADRVSSNKSSQAAYGDGRLAPHEWVRDGEGRIWKTDGFGNDCDHTLVGRQSFLWDVAGAIVEWDLDPVRSAVLLSTIRRNGLSIDPDSLKFYELSYAAFRLGITSLSSSQLDTGDPEQTRLEAAARFYADRIERAVESTAG